ncbi:MAG: extracellular solute-binding protein [Spirochaetaceae bacterium]|jgi:putative aldouronate transport system substrate-binding protein|nr:extracellular solute-binding protein [Spirochaetaceae bacterium]
MREKSIFLLFCFALLPCVLWGAGERQAGQAAGAAKPEITVSIFDRGWVPASEGTMEDNRWTRWINENSPVNVKFVPVLRSESTNRILTLFAAGTAPDMVTDYGKGWVDRLYGEGVIQPVEEHIEKYSVEYKQYLKEHHELRPYTLADDGKQYGMTSARNIWSTANEAIFIRKDWLDKFDLQPPKTSDELLTFLRRVRDEDPDGNGQNDTIGIGFNPIYLGVIGTTFGSCGFLVENGHYTDWTTTTGYRDYLAFMALLYREKLIDQEYVTDPQGNRMRQQLLTGKTGIWLDAFSTQMMNDIFDLKKNVPQAELITIDPWRTSQGLFDLGLASPDYYMNCMNKDAKSPEAVIKYLDWMISEGWWTLTFGLEGRHYRLVNGIPQNIDSQLNGVEIGYLQEYTPVTQYQITPEWFPIRASADADGQMWAKMQSAFYGARMDDKPLQFVPYTPATDLSRQFGSETSEAVRAVETNIIIGNVSLDEGLKQINDIKAKAGWDALIKERDDWYQKNKSNF